eukprot:5724121-Pleurochrysis_carterae.AAC.1
MQGAANFVSCETEVAMGANWSSHEGRARRAAWTRQVGSSTGARAWNCALTFGDGRRVGNLERRVGLRLTKRRCRQALRVDWRECRAEQRKRARAR